MKNNIKSKLLRKTYFNFIIKEFILTISIPFFFIIVVEIISRLNYQWLYNISPILYYGLIDVFNYIYNGSSLFFIVITIWIIGTLILLYLLLRKVFSYISALEIASNQLMDKSVEYIELPGDLEEIQKHLNFLKHEAEKNERMALESEQRKNDLIVYLAHDIKTPLTSMIGYLSLLDEMKDMPKKQKEKYISVTLEKSYKLEDLINELFDITRFNSEKILLEEEELNLNMMFEQILDDFYPILKEVNKEIKIIKNDKITLYGDSDKLGRVFGNVIKNAINYSSDNSEITIEIKKEEEFANIVISNKGKKISKEKLDRIFEKFYRADSSRTTKTGGSGLGLAIAKEIVELHGGEIKATSDEEFTKFYIKLPIHKH